MCPILQKGYAVDQRACFDEVMAAMGLVDGRKYTKQRSEMTQEEKDVFDAKNAASKIAHCDGNNLTKSCGVFQQAG